MNPPDDPDGISPGPPPHRCRGRRCNIVRFGGVADLYRAPRYIRAVVQKRLLRGGDHAEGAPVDGCPTSRCRTSRPVASSRLASRITSITINGGTCPRDEFLSVITQSAAPTASPCPAGSAAKRHESGFSRAPVGQWISPARPATPSTEPNALSGSTSPSNILRAAAITRATASPRLLRRPHPGFPERPVDQQHRRRKTHPPGERHQDSAGTNHSSTQCPVG